MSVYEYEQVLGNRILSRQQKNIAGAKHTIWIRIWSYIFSELKALKTPTKKEAGSKNSEFSETRDIFIYFGYFLI